MYVNLLKHLLIGHAASKNTLIRIFFSFKLKHLPLIFGLLLLCLNKPMAQVLQVGDAVISCAPPSIGVQTTVAVKRIQQVGTLYQNPANYGSDQSANIAEGMSWTTADFSGSEIFATAIDQETGTIYASSTVLYLGITETDSARIFEIDATTGAVSVLSTLPGNRGLGYLDIDPIHDQILTVNIDNGMIHRVDMTTGALLESFDPMDADTSVFTIAPVGERLLGLSYNAKENRVYYSVWATDNFATGNPNTIRSVALDGTGAFIPASDQLEITLPYRATAPTYSMPVGDIAFNYDYTSVLLAETGFDSDPLGPPSSAPHKSRVLKYDGGTGTWTQDNIIPVGNDQKYDIGDVNGHENSRGGVAWAYETVDSSGVGQTLNITEECEEYILLTGDALLGIPVGPPGVIYGLQFTDVDGGDSPTSIVADMDYEITATDKSIYGDVDIYKGYSANVGSYLWIDTNADGIQDDGETPLTGITMNLYLQTGPTSYSLVGTTTTDGEGEYYFDDSNVNLNGATGLLADTSYFIVLEDPAFNPGNYLLNFSGTNYELTALNIGSGARPDRNDADGTIAPVSFPFANYPYIPFTTNDYTRPFNHSLDMGFRLMQGDIGDFVWLDTNGNGVQDGGETGIENVMVIRYDANTDIAIDTVYSDNVGAYAFVDPAAGDYYLIFNATTNTNGYTDLLASPDGMGTSTTDSDPNPTTGQTASFNFDPNLGDEFSIDAGFYLGASLEGFVWSDANNNAQQDGGEMGLAGINVILYDSLTSAPIDTITTDATGIYSFTSLENKAYYIVFDTATVPANYQGVLQDQGADASDSDADPISGQTMFFSLIPGQTISNIDAGYFAPASIGNFVWNDLNYNGIQDGGETGIVDVEVVLFDAITDTPLDTVTTSALGIYEFTDLLAGDYYVYFDTSTGPTNAILSLQGQGTSTTDSDPDPSTGNTATITLAAGEVNQTIDAGFYVPASLEGVAWNDLNNNGQQEGGELGLPGIAVILYDNTSGLALDTVLTTASGNYQFDQLAPGSYYLIFDPATIPSGFQGAPQNQGDDATDSDADPTTGQTAIYILSTGINLVTENAGFFAPSTIGDLVWEDLDYNGQFDLGESGVPGIDVILYDSNTDTPLDTVTSMAGGAFQFTDVIPGSYYLIFDPTSLPPNYIGTLQDQGADASDSDADPTTGRTATFVVSTASVNDSWDAGFFNCIPVDAGADQAICSTDTITLNAVNGANYSWTPTGSLSCSSCPSPEAFPTTTTEYFVTSTVNAGCITTDSVTISVTPAPELDTVSTTQPTSCLVDNGVISILVNGAGLFEYSIDGGLGWNPNSIFPNLSPGTYNIMARALGGGCEETYNLNPVTLNIPSGPSIDDVTGTGATTCGGSDGTITITASGGSGTYQFSIDGGTSFQAGNTFNSLTSGTYNIVVEDTGTGCSSTNPPFVLTDAPQPVIDMVTSTDPTNCGLGNGTITITASGGSGSYEYSIDNGGTWVAGGNFIGLAAGSYTVLVRNDDGTCEVAYTSNPVVLTEPTAPIIDMVVSTDPTNCGLGNGTITITASSGSGSYEYSTDNGGTWVTGGNFIGLAAGSYTVLVRNDDGTCEVAYGANPVVLAEPIAPIINMVTSTDPTNCGLGNGTITITVSSGGGNEYSIDNGGTWVTGGNFIGLSAGSYTVLVRNDDGTCEVAYGANPVVLTEPSAPVIDMVTSTDPTNCGLGNGTITITASGGSGSYEYSTDNGGTWVTGGNFIGLAAGSYTVLVRNDDGTCEVAYGANPVVLTEPTAPVIDMVTSTDPTSCGLGDGTITITASGGSGSYEYSTDNGGTWVTGGNFIGLSAGSYTVLVRNDDGTCEVAYGANPVVLTEPSAPVIDMVTSTDPTDCGLGDGTITITASGGSGSYEYSTDNGGTWVTGGNFIGLAAGSYTVLVRNDDGTCEVAYTNNPVVLSAPNTPAIDMVVSTDPSTCGSGDGTITITASGGSGSYEYSTDNGGTWVTGGNFIGLTAGSYTVLVRNDDGTCEVAYGANPVVLTEPSSPVIDMVTSTDPTDCGLGDGTITITASDGSGSYEYSTDNGGTWVTGGNFIGLAAGSYTVLVRNDDGTCEVAYGANPVVLTAPTAPVIDMVTSTDPTSCGLGDGTITITASGGSGSYEYSTDNGGTWVTGGNFIGLAAGSYNVLVRNDDGTCEVAYGANPVVLTEPSSPVIDMVTSTDPTDCGLGDGTITITASGGSGSYEYSTDNGGTWVTGGNFIGLTAGSYTVLVRNDDGTCEVAYTNNPVVLSAPNTPAIDMVVSTDPSNCGLGDGTITITASGGSGSYEYSTDNGGTWVTGGNFIGLAAGSYTVLVRNDDGTCEVAYGANPVVLTEPSSPVIDMVTSTDPTDCGLGDGTITITASGGSGSYEYSTDNGGTWVTGGNFIGLAAGSYTVLVRNDDGTCEVAYTNNPVVLSAPNTPAIDMVVSTDPSNCGLGDGTITITASGGSGSYEYSTDNGGTWVTGGNFIGLAAGSYTVLVRNDDGSCEVAYGANPVVLTAPTAPVIDMVTSTDPSDCGLGDGTITITASGGSGSYEYSTDNGGTWVTVTGGNFIGLAAGSYTVLVRNDDGTCEVAYGANPVILTAPSTPVIDMVVSTDPSDCGLGDGTITITASGGIGSYEYSTDNGVTWVTGGNFIGLASGNYNVLVRNDDGTCEVAYVNNPVVLSAPNTPTIDMVVSTDPSNCGLGDGTITITASGGSGSYEYSIDNGGTWVTGGNFIGLAGSVYNVLVRNDDGSCEVAYVNNPVALTEPSSPTIDMVVSTDPSDCGLGDGTITITASGGSGSYEYSTDNGGTWVTGGNFIGLAAGSYTVLVRNDDGSCEVAYVNNPVVLNAPTAPVIDMVVSTDPTDCGLGNGTITITASGGIGSYEYSTDNGTTWVTGGNFIGLADGTYTVLVRNDDGTCELAYGANPVVLTAPTAPVIDMVVSTDPTACGLGDGTITITASGGSGSYEYSIDNGVTWVAGGNFIGLTAGTYTALVRNDDGTCEVAYAANPVVLNAPNTPVIDMVVSTDPTACGLGDGTITITASGGSGSYEYSIDNGGTWVTGGNFIGLSSGSYTVLVRNDDGSCETAYVNNPVVLNGSLEPVIDLVDTTDPLDCGATDGTITITASSGSGSYEYSIDNGVNWQAANSFTGLSAGTYNVQVRNDDGTCPVSYATNPVVLVEPTAPVIDMVNTINPSNCTTSDGTITITASSGTGSYEYSIDNGTTWQASGSFTGLATGSYTVVVRNDNGTCEVDYINNGVILSGPGTPGITIGTLENPSCGFDNGVITIVASGGSGSYEYSIDNGVTWQASDSFTGLTVGVYIIAVRNDDGTCPAFGATLNLTELPAPIIDMVSANNPSDCGIDDGTITITASAGIGFYEYSIDDGVTWQGSNSFVDLMMGSYNVWVRNLDDSCPVEYVSNPVLITAGVPPVIDTVVATNITDCSLDDGTITVTASAGNGSYEYSIDNGASWQTTNIFSDLTAGSYTVLLRNDNGTCEVAYANNPITITGPTAPSITMVNATDPSDCMINDGTIDITASAGSGNLEYSIDNGTTWSSTSSFTTLAAGSYDVLVRNDDGTCVQTYVNNPVVLFVPGLPMVSSDVIDASSCGEYGGAINLTVSGGTNFSYNWTGPNGFTSADQNIQNLEAGDYDVTVTNTDNSCPLVESITVGQGGLASCLDTTGITIPIINPVNICLDDLVNLPGNILTASVCADDPSTVSVSVDPSTNCIDLDPNDSFIGVDTICVVHCDDSMPQYCDTNYVIVNIEIPIDTIPVVIGQNDPVDICLDNTALQLQGTITSASFCDTGNAVTVLGTAVLDECITLDPADAYFGTSPDLICVVHCYDNNPSLCDTTYLEISVLPSIDTTTVTIPADVTTEICLDASILENTGTISSTSFCDAGNAITVEGVAISTNCVTFSPAIGFDGISDDTICVVHCYDNIPGFCDTTYIIVEVQRDPCDFIVEQVINQTIANCADQAEVCIDISSGSLGNYNITDNGVAYTGTTSACFDTLFNYNYTALTTATGPFNVSSWIVDGQSFSGAFNTVSELLTLMNTWNPEGNWIEDAVNNAIIGGTPQMTYSDITISTATTPVVLMRQTFLAPGGTNFSFGAGTHQFVFEEIASGCIDTVDININCNPCADDLYTGPDYIAVTDCDTIIELCVSIDESDLADYTITDNGAAYAGSFTACGTVSMIDGYNAANIPDAGANGPYFAEWILNGSTFTTSVMTIQEIVNAMNTWDPTGNWTLNLPTLVISGGDNMNTYGTLQVTQTNTSAEVTLSIESLAINLSDAMSLSLNTGVHELIFSNAVTGCLDTINIEIDCGDCAILDPGPVTLYTTDCDELAPYCLDISLSDLFNYSITDNGVSYANGIAGCDYDSLIVYQYNLIPGLGNAGPYTLDYWVLNGDSIMSNFTGLQDLVDSMNLWDPNGNWMINTNTFTIEGGDFNQNYGNMSVTQDGSGINAFVALGLGLVPQGSMVSLDTGFHQLIITDVNTGCENPIDITVECIEITPTIFGSNIFINTTDEYCLDTLELPGTIVSVENICDDQLNGNAGFVVDPLTLCVTYEGFLIGADTACMVICDDNGLCDTTYLFVNVVENCPDFFTMAMDTLVTSNCNDTLAYCLSLDSLQNYTFTDNGLPFTGGQEPCNFVDEVFYSYNALSGFGNAGPYTLNQWILNGVTISAQFDSIHALVDSMSVWDTSADWTLDPVNLIIFGGNPTTTYSVLEIMQNSSGQNSSLIPDIRSVAQSTALLFTTGMHQLIVTENATGCMDTLDLLVNCPFPDIVYDTIQVGMLDTLCMDVSALTGTIDTIYNDCPDNPGEFAVIDVLMDGSYCISYEAIEVGEETACIVVCDENVCDTTTVFITVIDTTVVMGDIIANPDNDTTFQNIPVTLDVLQNDIFNGLDTVYILTPPTNGTATVTPDGTDILYTPNNGYCDSQFPDVFDYVICNQNGCDTTFAAVFVLCSDLEIFTGFTPNGDDVNDRFIIEGVQNYPNNTLCVFNRWGNQVHLEKSYNNTWDGTWEGVDLPDGTYFYMFDTGEGEVFTGYVQIHR